MLSAAKHLYLDERLFGRNTLRLWVNNHDPPLSAILPQSDILTFITPNPRESYPVVST